MRHGRWLFLTLLAIIIVAFVFTIGNTPGCSLNQSNYQAQYFYGVDLNSRRARQPIIDTTSISTFLNSRQLSNNQQFQSEVMSRIALLYLADQIGLPVPTQAEIGEYVQTKAAFLNSEQAFDAEAYTDFLDSLETNPNMSQALLAQALREDFRIDQVAASLLGPGLQLEAEAILQAKINKMELALSVAEIDYNDFLPDLSASDEDLKAFFTDNEKRYEVPEKIQAARITFAAKNYPAKYTDEALAAHFKANRAQFTPPAPATDPSEDAATNAEVTFESVRDQVTLDYTSKLQMQAAHEAAQAFAYTLYEKSIDRDSAAFDALLQDSQLELQPMLPFTQAEAPAQGIPVERAQSVFELNDRRFFSDAYAVEDGFTLLIYQSRIPPLIPDFESVKASVQLDHSVELKRKLFNERGQQLKLELEAGIEAGKSFAETAQQLELKVSSFELFKVNEAPNDLNRSVLGSAQNAQIQTVSDMLNLNGTGTFIYVTEKNLPEIDANDDSLLRIKDYINYIRTRDSSSSFVNELVARGIEPIRQ
jgi:peptidyl-prolyl cis-trans isomerase D